MDECRKEEPYFDLLCSSPKNRNVTAEQVLEAMDSSGVDRSVIFGFGFRSQDRCRRENDYVIEAVSRYPDKFTGFATVNAAAGGVREELERCKASGLRGVGELMGAGQGADMADKNCMEELCGFCADNGWPLLVHVNEGVGHYYPGKTEDSIHRAETLAAHFPDTTFIFAHLGGGLCFYEAMPELRSQLSKVYYDSAAFPFLYRKEALDALKALGLVPKLLYGSDFPLLGLERYRSLVRETSFTQGEREAFFGGNAAALLGLA